MPIGKGGFQPVEASAKSGNVLGRLGQMAQGLTRAKQNIEVFNYQQDRRDESTLKRYAAETASKVTTRKYEFDLANKHIMTVGSDMKINPATGKRERVIRRNVRAGDYTTGEAEGTPNYGDKLLENTKLKTKMQEAKNEAARLRLEESKSRKPPKTKKSAAKKTAAGKPRVKKVTATKETTANIAVDSTGAATRIGKDGKMPPKRTGNVKKTSTGGGLTEIRNSTVETGSRGSKTTKAPKTTGTTNNPALTKMKNSGKVVF